MQAKSIVLAVSVIFGGVLSASAQVAYLDEQLNEALSQAGLFPISKSCKARMGSAPGSLRGSQISAWVKEQYEKDGKEIDRISVIGAFGGPLIRVTFRECTTHSATLKVGGEIQVSSSEITLGKQVRSDIGNNFQSKSISLTNCSASPFTYSVSSDVTANIRESITNSRQIVTNRSGGGGFSVSLWKVLSLTGSAQWSRQISTGEIEARDEGQTIREAFSLPVTANPMSVVRVNAKWAGYSVQIPWSATFVVDAPLGRNLAERAKASDVLDAADRTISTDGYFNGYSDMEVSISVTEEGIDTEFCSSLAEEEKVLMNVETVDPVSN